MIRGLSPIPRGGGKPGVSAPRSVLSSLTLPSDTSRGTPTGRRGTVLPRSGQSARSRVLGFARKLCGAFLHPETQPPPPAGSPKNHSPRRGPTILGGTFGARPCAPPEGRTAGARLRTLRAPLGTHLVGACCASAPNKRPSCLRTFRIRVVRGQARYSVFEGM